MATTTATIYVTTKSGHEWALDVDAEAEVTQGGSSGYGSDEPEWTEVGDVTLSCPVTGRLVGKRVRAAICKDQWAFIEDLLAESDAAW